MNKIKKIIEKTNKSIKLFFITFYNNFKKYMIIIFSSSKQNKKEDIKAYKNVSPKPILYVNKLYKKYPGKKAPAINEISFNVYPGEFHAFIGANGAGKTTTIKSLIGAYARWSGTILINGQKNTSEVAKKNLGYIPESARFPEKLSSIKYLMWMAKLSGLTGKNAKKFAESKLKELNMWNLRKKSPNTFSSGQKKKILLSQALIHDPDILIMDEPAANLDPKARIEFFDILQELKNRGKAIFVSSHILSELERYANSATILDGGKIIFSGKTTDLYKKYGTEEYIFSSDNNEAAIKYLKQKKIFFHLNEGNEILTIKFNNKIQHKEFFKYIISKKIDIKHFNQTGSSLDDIYKKLIKFGSVDTMKWKDLKDE